MEAYPQKKGRITCANTTLADNRAASLGLTAGLTLENLSFEPRYTAAFGTLYASEQNINVGEMTTKNQMIKVSKYAINGIGLFFAGYWIYIIFGIYSILPTSLTLSERLVSIIVREVSIIAVGVVTGFALVNLLIESKLEQKKPAKEYLKIAVVEMLMFTCVIGHAAYLFYQQWFTTMNT